MSGLDEQVFLKNKLFVVYKESRLSEIIKNAPKNSGILMHFFSAKKMGMTINSTYIFLYGVKILCKKRELRLFTSWADVLDFGELEKWRIINDGLY